MIAVTGEGDAGIQRFDRPTGTEVSRVADCGDRVDPPSEGPALSDGFGAENALEAWTSELDAYQLFTLRG